MLIGASEVGGAGWGVSVHSVAVVVTVGLVVVPDRMDTVTPRTRPHARAVYDTQANIERCTFG